MCQALGTRQISQAGVPCFRRLALPAVAAIAVFLLVGCGGGEVPPVKMDNTRPRNPVALAPGSGTVYIQLSEVGDDSEVVEKDVVAPLLEKALRTANIKISPGEEQAELVIHGTVTVRHLQSKRRLGLDHHQYAAQAAYQVIRVSSYRPVLTRDMNAEGRGVGRLEAITDTLTNLAGKMAVEVVPCLQRELVGR
jgi:hypothetical protein